MSTPFQGPLQPTGSRLPGHSKVWARAQRPGPASYTLGGSMAKQYSSLKQSTMGQSFGGETRENTLVLPSVKTGKTGFIRPSGSCGRQVEGKRATQPRCHFGTAQRDGSDAVRAAAFTFKT